MEKKRFVYWQDEGMWIGYFEEYPNYLSQGETFEELKENLRDIYKEFNEGTIGNIRRADELEVAENGVI